MAAEYHLTVREWPASERPREKLQQLGPTALSNAELLAILLRVGSVGEDVVTLSQRLLVKYGGLGGLYQAVFATLEEERGMGEAKTCTLKAALELGRRLLLDPGQDRVRVSSPGDVAQLLMMDMAYLENECLRTVLLNTKNMVLGAPTIYQGSVNSTSLRVGEVFREAVRHNATAMIVVHNHPSGDPTPSPEDVQVTRTLVEAGKMMDIEVLDHLVIGRQKYVSLKERRLGFS
jgi:DNA repair protein RadC